MTAECEASLPRAEGPLWAGGLALRAFGRLWDRRPLTRSPSSRQAAACQLITCYLLPATYHLPSAIRHLPSAICYLRSAALLLATLLLSLACRLGNSPGTAIPIGPPAQFEVQTATPTADPNQATLTPGSAGNESALVLPLGDAPTHTPDPNALPTLLPLPTDTPALTTVTTTVEVTNSVQLTVTPELTEAVVVAPTRRPPTEPDPPRQGGDWDFETDFIPWPNPYGEPCPGGRIASGWTAFVEDGPYGSSCLNENLYQPNVFSGLKSQEITFDFISANSGILRTIPTQVDHRYNIVVYAKNDRSISPVQMALGVDLSGGTDWSASTVQWFPWDNGTQDTWGSTEETVTAIAESMTIFIKGFHPMADQGGKTVIDNVSLTDLGVGVVK